jgi:hypothetical protein
LGLKERTDGHGEENMRSFETFFLLESAEDIVAKTNHNATGNNKYVSSLNL